MSVPTIPAGPPPELVIVNEGIAPDVAPDAASPAATLDPTPEPPAPSPAAPEHQADDGFGAAPPEPEELTHARPRDKSLGGTRCAPGSKLGPVRSRWADVTCPICVELRYQKPEPKGAPPDDDADPPEPRRRAGPPPEAQAAPQPVTVEPVSAPADPAVVRETVTLICRGAVKGGMRVLRVDPILAQLTIGTLGMPRPVPESYRQLQAQLPQLDDPPPLVAWRDALADAAIRLGADVPWWAPVATSTLTVVLALFALRGTAGATATVGAADDAG